MAFLLYSVADDSVLPLEYLPVAAITPKAGMALYESSGNLTTASASNIATHICMVEKSSACTAGDLIPVVRIQKDQIWESTLAATTTLAVGATTDVASGGLTVAAAGTAGSNLEIVYEEALASGSKVRVRFIK